MNIQEFNNLKVGDMVKVRGLGGGYIYDRIVAIERLCEITFAYNDWENIIRLRNHGAEWFLSNSIVRKIEKPELGKGYFCESEDVAEKFLEDCEAWGIKWNGGDRATSTKIDFWRKYLEEGVVFCMVKNLISREVCITAGSIKRFARPDSCFSLSDDFKYVVEYPNGKVIWDKEEEKKKRETEKNMLKIGTFNVRCTRECHKRCCKQCCPCPEVKEVKRAAKVGEYIKIVKPLYTFNEIGDILKVDYGYRNGGVNVKVEDHPRDAYKPTGWTDPDTWYYGYDRYVVLENYRP